jgi:hypothetical protein
MERASLRSRFKLFSAHSKTFPPRHFRRYKILSGFFNTIYDFFICESLSVQWGSSYDQNVIAMSYNHLRDT